MWHWTEGGSTNQGNLALLCSAHHRLSHRQRWHMELADDGTLTITLPDGTVRTTHPPGALHFAAA